MSGGAAAIAKKNSRMLIIASHQGGVGRRYSQRVSIGVMGRGLSRPRVRYLLVGMNVTSRIRYSPVISRKLG